MARASPDRPRHRRETAAPLADLISAHSRRTPFEKRANTVRAAPSRGTNARKKRMARALLPYARRLRRTRTFAVLR
ncbi:hypothetical protein F9948_02055 [Burkholderia thailandensis]|nr:hypothetical protein [Burkholderia thailandensis]MDD1491056.1 hypothetical protein [Burkholderia thailandensis]